MIKYANNKGDKGMENRQNKRKNEATKYRIEVLAIQEIKQKGVITTEQNEYIFLLKGMKVGFVEHGLSIEKIETYTETVYTFK